MAIVEILNQSSLEVGFWSKVENRFFQDMSGYLKKPLGVKSPILGTANHGHSSSAYRAAPILY